MTKLCDFIKTELNIPGLEAGDPVMDGCFFTTPYYTSTLRGNGVIKDTLNYIAVDMFYSNKTDCVVNTIQLIKALTDESRYSCQDPDYTYESDADMYHSTFNVIIIGGIE